MNWIYILISLGIVLVYVLVLNNLLVASRNRVEEAFSTMDVYLKKRWDLIPSLVEVVRGFAGHEQSTLMKVVELRSQRYDEMTTERKIDSSLQMARQITKVMLLSEQYPDLKASENFRNLSKQLAEMEDEIANSRKYYNGCVREYNNKILMIPNNLFAGILGHKRQPMFEASEQDKKTVEVKL